MLRNLHGITIQQQQEGGHRPADLKRPRASPASPIRQLVLGENIREIHIFLHKTFCLKFVKLHLGFGQQLRQRF